MDKKTLRLVAIVVVGVLVSPIVWDAVVTTGSVVYCGIANGINKIRFNKKIKKGLKDGSIIEIDGEYFEVQPKKED